MSKIIINLTQHAATPEQVAQGVFDLSPEGRKALSGWLTFVGLPTADTIHSRAAVLAGIAAGDSKSVPEVPEGITYALIGGAPYLMSALENALIARGITPLYSFTERVSVETQAPDGSVTKTQVFKHIGFVQI
jgi:hypothetical protein